MTSTDTDGTLATSFGSRLKFLRMLKGMTQAELAARANLSVKHVGRIERGEASPSFALIQEFAHALDTPPLNFFLHAGQAPTNLAPGFAPEDASRMPSGRQLCVATRLATWMLGGPGLKPFWSETFYTMLGYAPHAVRPTVRRFLKHVRPSRQEAAACFLDAVLQGQTNVGMMVAIVTKTGQDRKLMLNPDAFQANPDEPPVPQLIIQDVTDCVALNQAVTLRQDELEAYVAQKNQALIQAAEDFRLEAAQRAQVEKRLRIFEQMVNSSFDAQAFVNSHGIIVAVNQAYEKMTGLPAREVEGRNWIEYLVDYWGQEAFDATLKSRTEAVLRCGQPGSFHEWRTYKTGKRKYVQVNYTPSHANGDVAGVVVTVHDLTGFMQIHERLKQSDRLHRQILETANEGILMVDAGQRITFVNPKIEMLLGYRQEEVLHSISLAYVHSDDLDIAHLQISKSHAGMDVRFPLRLVHKNGQTLWTVISASPILNPDKSFHGALIMVMDVTELRLVNRSLQQHQELLELSAEATVSLLRETDQEQVISDILTRLGQITNSDRVYIFKNHVEEGTGRILASLFFEWVMPGIAPHIHKPEFQNVPYDAYGPRWLRDMAIGMCIKGLVRDFPDAERNLLEPQGVQSLLAVPIHIDGRLWGFLGFDAMHQPREWSPAEENALRVIATAIGLARNREDSK